MKKYYIGFFKFEDGKVWMRSQLMDDKEQLQIHLSESDYVDTKSINIREIELPE